MSDVAVLVTAEELEAEVVRSRLEAAGIPARIAPRSQLGVPASWSPRGLGYGAGSFAVRVPERYVADARRVLGVGPVTEERDEDEDDDVIARAPRPPLIRIVATVVLVGFLLAMLLPVVQLLGDGG